MSGPQDSVFAEQSELGGFEVTGGAVGFFVGEIVGGMVVGEAVAGGTVGVVAVARVVVVAEVVAGCSVVEVEVVVALVVVVLPTHVEHPAVSLTSATTASDHAPPASSMATQKKAPPLQANSALLICLRWEVTCTAWAALMLELVPEQAVMQWPKTTLFGSLSNNSLLKLPNKSAALICPPPLPSMPPAGRVTPL